MKKSKMKLWEVGLNLVHESYNGYDTYNWWRWDIKALNADSALNKAKKLKPYGYYAVNSSVVLK